jgi:hypothetical protein
MENKTDHLPTVIELLQMVDYWRTNYERLKTALETLRDCDWVISLPDRMDAVRDIARKALEGDDGK